MFCPEHPKRDQNPKFTPLSETPSIPTPFIYRVPPRDIQNTGFVSSYSLAEPAKIDSLVINHLSVVGSVAHEADHCLFQALRNRNARISAPFK